MTTYSKLNFVYRLQKWMDSVAGQTFLNYAYSWGASIVILGTLFKLTHLPGANFFLFLGMGTEVFVFFISAFDRPFDKTTDGMDLVSLEVSLAEVLSSSMVVAVVLLLAVKPAERLLTTQKVLPEVAFPLQVVVASSAVVLSVAVSSVAVAL